MSEILEQQILFGLIASDEYVKRIVPIWSDKRVETDEMRSIARWCLDYYKQYQKAPRRNIVLIYDDQTAKVPRAKAELIEGVLSKVSDNHGGDWEAAAAEIDDYLYDRTVAWFGELRLQAGIRDAEDLLDQGEINQAITAMAETAADAIEMAPAGDLSRARVAGWRIAMAGGTEERLSDPWGDPEPPPFDLSMLPRVLRHFVEVRSEMIGVGTNAMAWTTLAACGSALDASIQLQMKRSDPSFTVPPGIWLLLVGDPSRRKSPAMKAAFAPLHKIQAERIKTWERHRAAWLAEDPMTRGPEPTFVQLLTNSQTPEGIRDVLVGQDRGITIFADEWSSHIGAMGRYSAGRDAASADRAFFNSAFDGVSFTANRANRRGGDRIAVANLQVTVVGGVQPDKLRQLNRHGELLGDGMLQRSCPILMARPKLDQDIEAAAIIKRYDLLIYQLVAAPGGRVLQLSPEAEAIRHRLTPQFMMMEQNEALGRGSRRLPASFTASGSPGTDARTRGERTPR